MLVATKPELEAPQIVPNGVTPSVQTPDFLNTPLMWLRSGVFEAPLSVEALAEVQKEVDSVIGVTRNNESIAKIVWNGDTRYWKRFYDDWDPYGHPRGDLKRRPWVLYKTIYDDNDRFVRDVAVPRYLLLTRLEPEQYADTWRFNAHFYEPTRGRMVQYKPLEPPKEMFLWFRTIAEHRGGCCQMAAREDVDCYGYYAHPRQCLDELRQIRRGMDEEKMPVNHPFDSPDEISAHIREGMTNNYAEQAMEKYRMKASFLLDEAPLSIASPKLIEEAASRTKIRDAVGEALKRGQDVLENKLKGKGAI